MKRKIKILLITIGVAILAVWVKTFPMSEKLQAEIEELSAEYRAKFGRGEKLL